MSNPPQQSTSKSAPSKSTSASGKSSSKPRSPKHPNHSKLKAKNALKIVSNSKPTCAPDSDPDNEGSDDEGSSGVDENEDKAKDPKDVETEECKHYFLFLVYEVLNFISTRLPLEERSPRLCAGRKGLLCALVHLAPAEATNLPQGGDGAE
jgi:hypothetical protein